MNLLDLTTIQLKRAATIKEQIDHLNRELSKLLGGQSNNDARRSRLGLAARRRIAAAQKARWSKARKAKVDKPVSKPVARKSRMSAAARAKVAARMRAYWKAKKAGKKSASSGK